MFSLRSIKRKKHFTLNQISIAVTVDLKSTTFRFIAISSENVLDIESFDKNNYEDAIYVNHLIKTIVL